MTHISAKINLVRNRCLSRFLSKNHFKILLMRFMNKLKQKSKEMLKGMHKHKLEKRIIIKITRKISQK